MPLTGTTAEEARLLEEAERARNWKRWGPYLAERQWGTVREDYSNSGQPWTYFPHHHAASRAYRWGEDGLLGFCDRQCRLCFALAVWNTRDAILKERLFGLTVPQGNHGEDVKECYYYLESTPTHSYSRALYKYPWAAFPYEALVEENARRGRGDREYELTDTGIFDNDRYFDVFAEYAKAGPNDILARFTLANRGPEPAELHVLPTAWFRNTWIWGCRHEGCGAKPAPSGGARRHEGCGAKPRMERASETALSTEHETLGAFQIAFGPGPGGVPPRLLFTENETNSMKLFGVEQDTPHVKDAFHRYVINNELAAVNPRETGTKSAAHYRLTIPPRGEVVLTARFFSRAEAPTNVLGPAFEQVFTERKREADEFYEAVMPENATEPQREIIRQAHAGLFWTKQFYHYIVQDWLVGDHDVAPPPIARWQGRNRNWRHLYARDVISMPDKWEYPWFAAWDLAFHMIPMAKTDPWFAKRQLLLLLREWYMHPNGQIPAYEFDFRDVNPPVHAWACRRVYELDGRRDHNFLAKAFQRLLLNFTWWVNQIDTNGDNVFSGGFLGLDNIGIFDRSKPLPTGGRLEQADGTAWMAFYCGTMLGMALELAREDAAYSEMASKFLDHFVRITDAINTIGGTGLWDDEDGFYYDHLHAGGRSVPLKSRSLVGLMPLIAVEVLDWDLIDRLPEFKRRLEWFLRYRHDLARHISFCARDDSSRRLLLAIPSRERLERALRRLLDEEEFLSRFGIRSLSKHHEKHPFEFQVNGEHHRVAYTPGESDNWMFGGNSNWRGPIWFPVNYLLIEALEKYYSFHGDNLLVECPTGSGRKVNLRVASREINRRLMQIFLADASRQRPCLGERYPNSSDPDWRHLLFHEYFDAETGEGLGASHQTGWTALIARCIEKYLQPE